MYLKPFCSDRSIAEAYLPRAPIFGGTSFYRMNQARVWNPELRRSFLPLKPIWYFTIWRMFWHHSAINWHRNSESSLNGIFHTIKKLLWCDSKAYSKNIHEFIEVLDKRPETRRNRIKDTVVKTKLKIIVAWSLQLNRKVINQKLFESISTK